MGKFLFATVLFSGLSAHAVHFDPPDLSFEETLHRQYMHSLAPVEQSEESQTGLLENYQVQQGENLWTLSQMLYGDGNYWPKVWAQNQSITNPHLVRKGHVLQFLMGSEDETPAFRFSEEEGGLELTASISGTAPQIEVPPPEIPPRPVIKIPSSFPNWTQVFPKRPKTVIDESRIVVNRKRPPGRIPLTAYVQDDKLESLGTYLETEKEMGLVVANTYTYVKLRKGVGHNGTHLLVVRDMGKLKALNDQVETPQARFIRIYGELEITDSASNAFAKGDLSSDEEVFRTLVVRATDLTLGGYGLIEGSIQTVDMAPAGPSGSVTAQIIGSSKAETSALYGGGDIVFLNRGAHDGVQAGQILDLYIDRTVRTADTLIRYSAVPSGVLKIAKVGENCSTGVILSAVDSIQQGDLAERHPAGDSGAGASAGAGAAPADKTDLDKTELELPESSE